MSSQERCPQSRAQRATRGVAVSLRLQGTRIAFSAFEDRQCARSPAGVNKDHTAVSAHRPRAVIIKSLAGHREGSVPHLAVGSWPAFPGPCQLQTCTPPSEAASPA
uniref:uncharacterized protein LOC695175 isoform X2 n=1 Tax=Macaca mulatta TaxID=9544 RepID=UPI0010A20236|nr:uncharacterized protein LOC695175 isoform X2 [Macaca mulatta]